MATDDAPALIYSPLGRRLEGDDTYIDVIIYRGETDEDTGWLLEIEDEDNASTLYTERFPTAQAALDEALRAVREEGIRSFMERPADPIN